MKFVDTSFWIALRYARDRRHAAAREMWLAGTGALITSNLVIGETWTFLRRRSNHRRAMEFYDAAVRHPSLTIRFIDDDVEAEAWRWLRRRDERPYSFVDATSFIMM